MQEETQTPSPHPALISEDEKFFQSKLQKFTYTKEGLAKLAEGFQELIEQGTEAGQKAIYEARQVLKKNRVQIKKEGAALREFSNAFNKAVLDRERDLIVEIEPTEEKLGEIEDEIIALKKKEKEEADLKEKKRIQEMIDRLQAIETAADVITLMGMTEEQFEEYYKECLAEHKIVLEKRKEDEARKKEEAEAFKKRQAELKKEEERQEAVRKEQADKEAKLKAQQDKIDAENKRIEEDRLKQENIKNAMKNQLRASRHKMLEGYGFTSFQTLPDLGEMPLPEFERLETIHRNAHEERIKEENRKKEQERIKREEEDKREALLNGDDQFRFKNLAELIEVLANNDVWNLFQSKTGKRAGLEVADHINRALIICRENAKNAVQIKP